MIDGHFSFSQDFVKVFEAYSGYVAVACAMMFGVWKAWTKYIKDRENNDNSFITVHGEIHEVLTELRVLTDSARAQVIQFHNGEYFMDGVSMRKFSITHESLEKGIESDANRIKGVLCSMFIPLLNLVLEDAPKIHYTVDLKNSYLKQYLESRSVEAFSVLPIKIQNQTTGFIMVQWCSGLKAERIDETFTMNELTKIRNQITAQLGQQKR
jgi:hypothetical protein